MDDVPQWVNAILDVLEGCIEGYAEAIGLKRTDYVMEPIPNLDEPFLL